MNNSSFRAMVVCEEADGMFTREITNRKIDELPAGEVLIRVAYSSLNYKDALSATGNKGVTKTYPHTPGIDAAGVVEHSDSSLFKAGDEVIVTGYDLGMNTRGGFGEYIRVPAGWIVPLPESLSLKEAMIFGTAGFTAGLCVHALLEATNPDKGEILVTGATGGVGCLSIAILSKLGYTAVAGTGKQEEKEFFTALGAAELISREKMLAGAGKPILRARWAGVIDTVGGEILANAIKSTMYGGTVAACGNAASSELPMTVFPFILRAVHLQGIDSQNCLMELRRRIWQKLADEWKPDRLDMLCTEIGLEELNEKIELILQGSLKGRTIVGLRPDRAPPLSNRL